LERSLRIRGARTHNLRDLSLDVPHRQLTVVTGVSGSGKSSLVFDTLYAEGQRRYVQSLSTYARLFLERLERPDVDSISDIPPALALKQKNTIKNARSTVGTVTEISDYLRLLFAAAGRTICPKCDREVTADTIDGAAAQVLAAPGLYVFVAPFAIGSRASHEVAAYLAENGYHRVYLHDSVVTTEEWLAQVLGNGAVHDDVEVVIDRVAVQNESGTQRLREALEKAFHLGGGRARAIRVESNGGAITPLAALSFDRRFNCSGCGSGFTEPTAALFSATSPLGACPQCEGFGRTVELDLDKVIPEPGLSLRQGLIAPWRTPAYREMQDWMLRCARRLHIRTSAPLAEMSEAERSWLLDGEPGADGKRWDERWPGVRGFFRWLERKRYKTHVRILLARYRRFIPCPGCGGNKLRPEALNVVVDGKTIAAAGRLAVRDLPRWFKVLRRDSMVATRCAVVLRELDNRVGYLNEVGLGYLTLERQSRTLSGGEAQRIHLAGALGNLLTGTLYALDEPTVGLHAADSRRLLEVLRHLRDLGNTVVVVEHDPAMIAGADHVVELGPEGGRGGGNLVGAGPPKRTAKGAPQGRALLMRALARQRCIGHGGPVVKIVRAAANNLQGITLILPLRRLICLTGVSGSGKSTLMETVLYNNYLRRRGETVSDVGECDRIEGLEQVSEIVHMGQEMPTRSLRSNPATYLKIYDDMRKLFANSPEGRRLKVKPRDFSFNVDGGRCERCHGVGTVTIEMHFMADLEVPCEVCEGRRFKSHILAIRFQGRNVNEALELTIDEAMTFFAKYRAVTKRLEPLAAVGLGYLQLGQPSSTLSGGEMQRLKLARFLLADLEPQTLGPTKARLGRLFLLDEPTTGLASSDIKRLMRVLTRLVAEGNTLVVIEHNLELIAQADYVVDLGPGGGDEGGKIVATGDPLKIAAYDNSLTGRELRRLFGLPARPGRKSIRGGEREAAAAHV
jgi:excinuclease ABC subunit A